MMIKVINLRANSCDKAADVVKLQAGSREEAARGLSSPLLSLKHLISHVTTHEIK